MEVVGADGVHVGTVEHVVGDRLDLVRPLSGPGSRAREHFLPADLVTGVEGNKVRLSAKGNAATRILDKAPSAPRSNGTPKTASPGPTASPFWNWNRIGIGAIGIAAAGAGAAGAALLSRKTPVEDDFEYRLETDENVRLISSDKVEGTKVIGTNGETLGHIKSFMVDKYTGRVAYAIMAFGGTMGFGNAFFPVPWPMLEYDVARDGYALDITSEQLAKAPRFEAASKVEFTPEYRRNILMFYRS